MAPLRVPGLADFKIIHRQLKLVCVSALHASLGLYRNRPKVVRQEVSVNLTPGGRRIQCTECKPRMLRAAARAYVLPIAPGTVSRPSARRNHVAIVLRGLYFIKCIREAFPV